MSAQGKGVREIASTLGMNKDTAAKLVREERRRRSHDREAEEEVRRAIGSMRIVLDELWKQWNSVRGDGPMSGFAKARLAESIRKVHRDLVGLYNVVLPETEGQRILDERAHRMMHQPLPDAFPEVGEQVAVEERIREMDRELEELMGKNLHPKPEPSEPEDDGGEYLSANWDDDPDHEYDAGY